MCKGTADCGRITGITPTKRIAEARPTIRPELRSAPTSVLLDRCWVVVRTWNYTPLAADGMMGMPFMGYAQLFSERGPHRIGSTYRKALYREYTDETFSKLKPRSAEWQHLGMLGPVLRAEVGDTIKVVFKNNTTHPFSMHPHGVFYAKDSEGAGYDDGASSADKSGVPPGKTHIYTWEVPERAGPGPNDPSSIVWLYHSHADEPKDVESGLVGAIIISREGMAGPTGRPKDVDREFVNLFMIVDENTSWYLQHNIDTYTSDPKGVSKLENSPSDHEGNFSLFGSGFAFVNFRSSINGFMFGNMPMMTMKKGERVRWYVVTICAQCAWKIELQIYVPDIEHRIVQYWHE